MNNTNNTLIYRVIVVGDANTGKTNILLRYTDNAFSENISYTIGVDFRIKQVRYQDKNIKLQLWDTAGQDRYNAIIKLYYRGAHVMLMVYDITDISSYHHIQKWHSESYSETEKAIKILVGNKLDYSEIRGISYNDALSYADSIGVPYIETSAKTGENVDKLFELILDELLKINSVTKTEIMKEKKVVLVEKTKKPKSSCC